MMTTARSATRRQAASVGKPAAMIVAGVMSGTSADGIDVALVKMSARGGDEGVRVKLVAHEGFPFSPAMRRAILEAMNAERTTTAQLARLNWRLGIAYAEAVEKTMRAHPCAVKLIGCHGQTLYHQGRAERFLERSFACTWQAGEAAVMAQRLGIPVVSNFRPADMMAGGQGAPLVPLADYLCFQSARRARVLQNIGGIANLTAIPAGAQPSAVMAFDTGPGNMVIDALMQRLLGRAFDADGGVAARGVVLDEVMRASKRALFFNRRPPKSAGREEFGREFAERFLAQCRKYSDRDTDAVATATALTAWSIAEAYRRFAQPQMGTAVVDYVVSGGGARNATLMHMLRERLEPMGCQVTTSDAMGYPAEAKEAMAFALLAWQTWHRRPGNLPTATGAGRAVMLGQVTYV